MQSRKHNLDTLSIRCRNVSLCLPIMIADRLSSFTDPFENFSILLSIHFFEMKTMAETLAGNVSAWRAFPLEDC
jgi:hypothetical protein